MGLFSTKYIDGDAKHVSAVECPMTTKMCMFVDIYVRNKMV